MTEAQAIAKLKALMIMMRGQGDVSPDQFARMACASVGIELPQRTPGAIRQKRWRDTHRRNAETPVDTLARHIERNERNACETLDETDPSPTPPDSLSGSGSGSGSSPENSSSLSASSGSESKRARRTKRARRVPVEWEPKAGPDGCLALAKKLGLSLTAFQNELGKFRDHEFAAPRSDWDAAFRNWLRRAAEHASGAQNASSQGGVPIVAHKVFRPEPPLPSSEKPSLTELDVLTRKVLGGRAIGT